MRSKNYLVFFLFAFGLSSFLNAHNGHRFYDSNTLSNSLIHNNPQENIVYICMGGYAYAYHSRSNCPGLGNCRSEIKYTYESVAINSFNRVPCCRCWSNVYGRCKDDASNHTKFEYPDYIPQLSADDLIMLSQAKQNAYNIGFKMVNKELSKFREIFQNYFIRNCDIRYGYYLDSIIVSRINKAKLDLSLKNHVQWAINTVNSANTELFSMCITSTSNYYKMLTEWNKLSQSAQSTTIGNNYYNKLEEWRKRDNLYEELKYKPIWND
ncbi:MAG: hypothetical protein ACON5K_01285 [Bacteroidia bacterium]